MNTLYITSKPGRVSCAGGVADPVTETRAYDLVAECLESGGRVYWVRSHDAPRGPWGEMTTPSALYAWDPPANEAGTTNDREKLRECARILRHWIPELNPTGGDLEWVANCLKTMTEGGEDHEEPNRPESSSQRNGQNGDDTQSSTGNPPASGMD